MLLHTNYRTLWLYYARTSIKGASTFYIRFVPKNFEKIFRKHAHRRPDALTWLEIRELLIANRDLLDPISWYVILLHTHVIHTYGC